MKTKEQVLEMLDTYKKSKENLLNKVLFPNNNLKEIQKKVNTVDIKITLLNWILGE